MNDDLIRDNLLEKHPEAREMRYPPGTFKRAIHPVCTLDRTFLESVGANLYILLHEFREALIDQIFEEKGTRYKIYAVELVEDKFVAWAWEVV
jgi:hypothetical protein